MSETVQPLATFRLDLPPNLNHAYARGRTWGGRRNVHATDELRAWQEGVALVLGGWEPPKRTPLAVWLRVCLPANQLNTVDLDAFEKFLVDGVVGKRRDQWVRRKVSEKQVTQLPEGYALVTVSVLAQEASA